MPRKPKTPLIELPAIPAALLEQFGNDPKMALYNSQLDVSLHKLCSPSPTDE